MLSAVLEALQQTTATRREIVDGASVEYDWLSRMMRGAIDDPGVKKIERLYWFFVRRGDIDPGDFRPAAGQPLAQSA